MKRILHPTDFSTCSEHALRHALRLARQYDAALDVLHVLTLYEPGVDDPVEDTPAAETLRRKLKQRVTDRLDALVAAHQDTGLAIRTAVHQDLSAAPAVNAYAEAQGTDLIVMGTHGRTGVRHMVLGSIAEQVVRHAPCSVLTVRENAAPEPAPIQRILVPIDFSSYALDALRLARALAAEHDAHLDLLYVIEPLSTPSALAGAMTLSDLVPNLREKSLTKLRQIVAVAEGPAVVTKVHVTEGHAASGITDFAESVAADLIVIATHGLSAAERFFLGSVAERVVRRAPCPVYVVRPTTSDADRAENVAQEHSDA